MQVDVTARSDAPPERVFALLADGASWPRWSGHDSYELERPDEHGGQGVGAVRVFRKGRVRSREEVAESVPGRRMAYRLLSGMPLTDYLGEVDLTPDGTGTLIRWHTAGKGRPDWFYGLLLRIFIRRAARGLAREAARPTG